MTKTEWTQGKEWKQGCKMYFKLKGKLNGRIANNYLLGRNGKKC